MPKLSGQSEEAAQHPILAAEPGEVEAVQETGWVVTEAPDASLAATWGSGNAGAADQAVGQSEEVVGRLVADGIGEAVGPAAEAAAVGTEHVGEQLAVAETAEPSVRLNPAETVRAR